MILFTNHLVLEFYRERSNSIIGYIIMHSTGGVELPLTKFVILQAILSSVVDIRPIETIVRHRYENSIYFNRELIYLD